MSTLFPEGITNLADLPHTLHSAITSALMYLGFEELRAEDRPPKNIWTDMKALNAHFKKVEAARKVEAGGGDIRDEPIEGPVVENEEMAALRGRR